MTSILLAKAQIVIFSCCHRLSRADMPLWSADNILMAPMISDGYPNGKPSANGILINGRRVTTHILQDQDEIVFGPQVKVIYYLLKQHYAVSGPDDEFDITLISPNMIDEEEEF
jgi:hypothetical protein